MKLLIFSKAMLAKPKDKQSFRGPDYFKDGLFEYSYQQRGDVLSFSVMKKLRKWHACLFT